MTYEQVLDSITYDQMMDLRRRKPMVYSGIVKEGWKKIKNEVNRMLKPIKTASIAINKSTGQGTPIREAKLFLFSYLIKKYPEDVFNTEFFNYEQNIEEGSTRKKLFTKIEPGEESLLYPTVQDAREDPWVIEFYGEFFITKNNIYPEDATILLSEIVLMHNLEGDRDFLNKLKEDFTNYSRELVDYNGEEISRAIAFLRYKTTGRAGRKVRGSRIEADPETGIIGSVSKTLGYTRESLEKIKNITIENAKEELNNISAQGIDKLEDLDIYEYISLRERFFILLMCDNVLYRLLKYYEDRSNEILDEYDIPKGFDIDKLHEVIMNIGDQLVTNVKNLDDLEDFLDSMSKEHNMDNYEDLENFNPVYPEIVISALEKNFKLITYDWFDVKGNILKDYKQKVKEAEKEYEKLTTNQPTTVKKEKPLSKKQQKEEGLNKARASLSGIKSLDDFDELGSDIFMIDEKYSRKIEPGWRRTKYLGPDNEKIQLFPNGLDDMSFTGKRGSYDLDYEDPTSYIRDDEDEDGGDFAYNENEETDGFDMERLSRYDRIRPRDHHEDYYDPFENDQLDPFMSMPGDEDIDIDIDIDYEYADYDTIDDEMDGSEFYEDDDIEDEYIEDEPFVDSYNTKLTNKEVNRLMLENYRNRLQYNSSIEQRYRYGW